MNQQSGTNHQEHAAKPRVFVYGTLRRGGSNHFRMEGCRCLGSATVRGWLHQVDWYPALRLDAQAGEVVGDLYEVSDERLTALDDYEGPEYRRVRATVRTAEDEDVSAWIWEWDRETEGLRLIADGDWLAVERK